jgi:hypothetical protein
MKMTGNAAALMMLAALLGCATVPALADEVCTDFKWDVTQERALFAGSAAALLAGVDLHSAPVIVPNRLYQLQLMPQDQVRFAAIPGKKTQAAGTYAGLATLKVPAFGSYRVAIDAPFWIDVVSAGLLLAAKDFQGQHGCNAPHKIVEFDLLGSGPFILQVSSASAASVRLTITGTPSRKL